ncbi:MAG: D-alanyl-D-alanine carboxypeptidase/D-alanyl-D-alanine-endopeptidase [Solirubrobacteraceae bacterium]|nr:D-alanyl-D-alanine carboxypeptidase/D-alanyl-D-alanine-endopeptidase [Solirubrobacteraceae bacterium]
MRRIVLTLIALVAALTGAAQASAAATLTETRLRAALAGEMRQAPASSGVYVADMDSGKELFARRQNAVRIPASVEKLFVTSSALLRLGASATLQTTAVTAPGAVVTPGGVLRGDLVLVGGGDPFFGDESAARLIRALRTAGVRRVEGAVVGDERAFDHRRRSSCCAGYDPFLGGVLSALAYDRGIFGGRARLDAANFAASRFTARLRNAGVPVAKSHRAGAAPQNARTLASVPSRSIGELSRFINVPSNNFAAEMLLLTLGARYRDSGTRASGARVVRETLDDFGVRPKVIDGSGLSRVNRATPREVVRLLERMHRSNVARSFRESLAVAGVSGTVRARMRGTAAASRCRVKTGTLRLVSALAGYCRTASGRTIGFAFMFNRANTSAAKAREDRMAAAIARLGGSPQPAPAPAPAPAPPPPPPQPPPPAATGGGAVAQP